MVMEAAPSPQSVGREFVRQYYTLLNKAPTHLHRFYNQQSSFIHGGLDPPNRETSPVVGQKQIHQKIQQLNFRDCHAKITQVDSQATLGKGVVVQVTGELSNAGQPMRRFTQTFVLAAQSPKKYYVHNDIFRYQDEIISDEECDTENRSEPDEDVSQDCQVLSDVQQISQPPMQYYPPSTPIQATIPTVPPHHQQPPPPPHVLAPPPTVNGAIHPDELNVMQGPGPVPTLVAPQPPPPGQQPQVTAGVIPQPLVQSLTPTPLEEQPPQTLDAPIDDSLEINYNDQPEQEQEQVDLSTEPAISSNEPKTYANLLKSGSNIPYNYTPIYNSPPQQQRPPSPPIVTRDQSGGNRGGNNRDNRGPRVNQSQQQQRGISRQDSGRGAPGRTSFNEDDYVADDRKRSQGNTHGDTNQLFLGNLPHTATEDELREIFIQFGVIVDLRVHSKPPNKAGGPPGARSPPNYGFITYESQVGVQQCLAAKPIYYPKDDKNGTQLNVEEKKVKDRQSFGGGGGRPSNDNRPRGGDQGPRRGGSGGNMNNSGGRGGSGGGVGNTPGGGNLSGGGNSGLTPNRTNNYNRNGGGGGGGGPPNRGGPNNFNRR